MFKKFMPWYLLGLVVLSLAFIYGCGNATGGGGGGGGGSGGVVTNYTITGNLPQMAILSLPPTVTSVFAIGTDGSTFTSTVSTDGTFSLGLVKGVSYVLGFYDVTTLEGYLCVPSLGWHSLPITDPTGEAIDLGTLTVEAGSLIVTCEISGLADSMQMTPAAATLYGSIDSMMKNLLNIDVNKNNIPDFNEDIGGYYLTIDEYGGPGSMATGEIEAMLTGFNDSYAPCPSYYQYWITTRDKDLAVGTVISLEAPDVLTGDLGSFQTMTREVQSSPGNYCKYAHFGNYGTAATSPATPPPGTYVARIIGGDTYTFDNCDFSGAYTIGTSEGIVYPVFHLATYEAPNGITYISTVEYKWQVVDGLGIRPATAAEVKAVVGNYTMGTAIAGQSPNIQFQAFQPTSETTCTESYIYFERDFSGSYGTLDLTTALINGQTFPPIKLEDVSWIQAQYMTSTNIQIDFRLGWDHTSN